MALVYFVLLWIAICIALCLGVAVCFYYLVRRPRTLMTQQQALVYTAPTPVFVPAPQPPPVRPSFTVNTNVSPYRNSSLSYAAQPAAYQAVAPAPVMVQAKQPLLAGQTSYGASDAV
jgi:hypothetical protein